MSPNIMTEMAMSANLLRRLSGGESQIERLFV